MPAPTTSSPAPAPLKRAARGPLALFGERAIEAAVYLCGISAIVFVFGIFFFVFKEGAPMIGKARSPKFHLSDLRDPTSLATKLKRAEDPVSAHLAQQLSGPTLQLLTAWQASGKMDQPLRQGMVSDLNQIMSGASIWNEDRFSKVELRTETKDSIKDDDVVNRNKLLLEDAYPLELSRTRFSFKEFFFSKEWIPTSSVQPKYGTWALIVGTLSVTLLAMLIAVPFGLGAAVFVSEFCTGKVKETLKIVIELLAAIPSVVWGFIGLSVMSPVIIATFHVPVGVNLFNAALLLALMSVPIMVSIGEDALKAVPDSYREAAVALGATRWQMVYRVLIPAAKNGLLAAVLLGVGRAIGETMAVLMATGHAVNIPHSIFDPVRTLTATIAAELGETSQGSPHYQVLFLIGVLLFSITFVVNLAADLIVKGIKKK